MQLLLLHNAANFYCNNNSALLEMARKQSKTLAYSWADVC